MIGTSSIGSSFPKSRLWYLILLLLLLHYNISSGFLPDENFGIPMKIQYLLAYFSGVPMSMYFAFYIYKAFDLDKLKFFATWGPVLFMLLPFGFLFVVPYVLTGNLILSRELLVIVPTFYIIAFVFSLAKAFKIKYNTLPDHEKRQFRESRIGVYIALFFWSSLAFFTFIGGSQVAEQSMTNTGFLIMTILYVRNTIINSKKEYLRLVKSEKDLRKINEIFADKLKARTRQLEIMNEQKTNLFINLAHETKTPLTLIKNYLNEYIDKFGLNEEIEIIQLNIDKLWNDIVNFFDIEKFKKGKEIYSHDKVINFSCILNEQLMLFRNYARKINISLRQNIEDDVLTKADPESIRRIINNLVDNAIKFNSEGGEIDICLVTNEKEIIFTIKDTGVGIDLSHHQEVFKPYIQINREKKNNQGIGLGLAIVKKIVESLNGRIDIQSNPAVKKGTTVEVYLPKNNFKNGKIKEDYKLARQSIGITDLTVKDEISGQDKPYILLVEDNVSMLNFLSKKLKFKYNLYLAVNGREALKKMDAVHKLDLIICDIMMDIMTGFEFLHNIKE